MAPVTSGDLQYDLGDQWRRSQGGLGGQFERHTKGWCVREGREAEQIKKRRRKGRMGGNIWGVAPVLGSGLQLWWSFSDTRRLF